VELVTYFAQQSLAVCHQLKDEEDTLQENIDYVNEQIQECQMEIMQVSLVHPQRSARRDSIG